MANKRSLKLAGKDIDKETVAQGLAESVDTDERGVMRNFAEKAFKTTLVGLVATSISTLLYIGLDIFAYRCGYMRI